MLRALTILSVGLTCKSFLRSGLCAVSIQGLDIFTSVIDDSERLAAGQGVLTGALGCYVAVLLHCLLIAQQVSNHISTLDDPVVWGVLPTRYYLQSHTMRWALGASEIIFTNPIFSACFRLGQTLETFRGHGVYQPSVDAAIEKLNMGHWVHLFSEGGIREPLTYPRDSRGYAHLTRFKWGVGRMLMDCAKPPIVIPIWITGFEDLMPVGRPFPWNYIPQVPAQLGINFGQPIRQDNIQRALTSTPPEHSASDPTAFIRRNVTALIQSEVEALGRSISGISLDSKSSISANTVFYDTKM